MGARAKQTPHELVFCERHQGQAFPNVLNFFYTMTQQTSLTSDQSNESERVGEKRETHLAQLAWRIHDREGAETADLIFSYS